MSLPETWEPVAKLAGVLVPFVLGILGLIQAPDRTRRRLKADSEILKNLPEDSTAYVALLTHIEEQIETIRSRSTSSRDWLGFVLAVFGAPAAGWIAVTLLLQPEAGWKLVGWIAAGWTGIAVLGAFQSMQLVDRNEKGMPLAWVRKL